MHSWTQPTGGDPTIEDCGSGIDLESVLVGTLTAELQKQLKEKSFDLGVLSYTVEEVKEGVQSADKLRIEGKAQSCGDRSPRAGRVAVVHRLRLAVAAWDRVGLEGVYQFADQTI